MVWRSPEDQPGWARPLLLVVVAVAALVRSWRAGPYLETYYAAAVRSMSMSWHNFFFASFDPAGTVTLDKLPGAFWIQALSVRLFGVHTWAIVLPQVVEGVLSVMVIYRIVRRLSGPAAGLVAAGVLALSPAAVALDRGNISDTLMILLLLLGANSVTTAITARRWRASVAGRALGRARLPSQDDRSVDRPACPRVGLPRRCQGTVAPPGPPSRVDGGRDRVGLPQLDDRCHPRPVRVASVRRRKPEQLALPPGVRLQRIRQGRSALARTSNSRSRWVSGSHCLHLPGGTGC